MFSIFFALVVAASAGDAAKNAENKCAPYDTCIYEVKGSCAQDHPGPGPCHPKGIGKNPCADWMDSKGRTYHMTCVSDSDAALVCGDKTSGECTITHTGCCSPTEVLGGSLPPKMSMPKVK